MKYVEILEQLKSEGAQPLPVFMPFIDTNEAYEGNGYNKTNKNKSKSQINTNNKLNKLLTYKSNKYLNQKKMKK